MSLQENTRSSFVFGLNFRKIYLV